MPTTPVLPPAPTDLPHVVAPPGRRARAGAGALRIALPVLLLAGLSSCAHDRPSQITPVVAGPVRPALTATSGPGPTSARTTNTGPTSTGPINTGPINTEPINTRPAAPATTGPRRADDGAVLRTGVDGLLLRYDRALTALSADPGTARSATSADRRALDAVVAPGSQLAEVMATEVVRRADEEDQVVVPPPGGLSYRHRALRVERTGTGTVEFTWCGHSPGIGLDRTDGTVLDDAVAHSHGVGTARTGPGQWTLESLDQVELRVLPPGSPDPCPSEVR